MRHIGATHSRLPFYAILSLIVLHIGSTVVVTAQSSSCSTAQSVSVPFTSNVGTLSAVFDEYFEDVCASGAVIASDLPDGHWFTYRPAVSRVALFSIRSTDIDDYLGGYSPYTAVFKGTCDSLLCESISSAFDEKFVEVEAGVDYFIYVYREADFQDPYILSITEIDPPLNDIIENAIAFTSQDIPFQGDYTTYGARSDFGLDACALQGQYGVWFSYTPDTAETLSLRVNTGSLNDVVGVQVPMNDNDNIFQCVVRGSGGSTLEWDAMAKQVYYILVTDLQPAFAGQVELTLHSLGSIAVPTESPTLSTMTLAPAPTPSLAKPSPTSNTPVLTPKTASPMPLPTTSSSANDESAASKPPAAMECTVVVASSMVFGLQMLLLL